MCDFKSKMQKSKCKIIKNQKSGAILGGFTIIEALVFLFIFSVITLVFYATLSLSSRYIIDTKNRLGALLVAKEKMEIIRNLAYDDIGTINGAVSGILLDEENISENFRSFHVRTVVSYIEDDLDGVFPTDTVWEDYKKVIIAVTWTGASAGSEEVRMSSLFMPPGLEVANSGDGILVINVFSDQPGGSGVPNSSVRVVNSETGLDTTVQTDSSGNVVLMGDKIKNSIRKYRITLSKSGYETVNTLPPHPDTSYNPIDVHASVVTGTINVANIVQNKLAKIKVSTVNYLGNTAIPGIDFHLEGGRIMGYETESPFRPVYNLKEDKQTNSNGEKDFGLVSPGRYFFELKDTVTDYVLIDTDPVSPFSLFSDDDLNFKAKLADKNVTSLLVRVARSVGGDLTPIEGANVRLSDGNGYNVEQTTSATGTAFFPTTADPLLAGNYTLFVIKEGFDSEDYQVTIETNELKTENVVLAPL